MLRRHSKAAHATAAAARLKEQKAYEDSMRAARKYTDHWASCRAESTADMAALALVHLSSQQHDAATAQHSPSSPQQAPAAQEVVVNSDDAEHADQRACEPSQATSLCQEQEQLPYQPSPASSGRNENSNHSSGTQPTCYSAGDAAPKGSDTRKQRKRKFEEAQVRGPLLLLLLLLLFHCRLQLHCCCLCLLLLVSSVQHWRQVACPSMPPDPGASVLPGSMASRSLCLHTDSLPHLNQSATVCHSLPHLNQSATVCHSLPHLNQSATVCHTSTQPPSPGLTLVPRALPAGSR
jgi:hypothetical protein